MNIKILLADDHKMLRAGLCSLLKNESDMEVIAEVANGRSAVQLAAELSPDVVVMDIAMPDLNGIEATRQIAGRSDVTKVIALSAHSDPRMTAEMLKAGARGYVVKNSAFEELALAVRSVMDNRVYISASIAGDVVQDYVRGTSADAPASVFTKITSREREVLQLLAEGLATKQVAHHLSLSVKTVESHRRNLMEKLQIESVAELTKYAIREGITSLEPLGQI